MYFAYKTGNSGGKIRHTEILSGSKTMETIIQNTETNSQKKNQPETPLQKHEEDEEED